ncbi:ATP-binding cassette sub-family C member 4-like isoform X1 [Glandiceps talaboti]
MEEFKTESQKNPGATANHLSWLVFWWLNPLFRYGNSRSLEVADMYETLPEDSAEKLSNGLEREWKKEVNKKKNENKASLAKAIIRTFGVKFMLLGITVLLKETLKIISALLLAQLIDCLAPDSSKTQTDALLYAAGIAVCSLFFVTVGHPGSFAMERIGMRMRISCCSLVYRKALKMSHIAMGQTTTGQIVNLLSNDVNKFDELPLSFHYVWVGPLECVAVLVTLWRQIGPYCLAGFVGLFILLPFQIIMGKVYSKLRQKTAVQTDQRVRIMNEIISGMRVIKMYTWEKPFGDLIRRIRRKECKYVDKSGKYLAINLGGTECMQLVIMLFICMAISMSGGVLSPKIVFPVYILIYHARVATTILMTIGVRDLVQALVSTARIQKFLLLDELDKSSIGKDISLRPKASDCEVSARDVIGSWDTTQVSPTLKDITFEVKPGQLMAVIGPVGSGKSSLLMTLLGEMPVTNGKVQVKGKVAYASQQSWVFSASFRQNILFGMDYDKKKYDKVIEICALKRDIQLLPDGDFTMVGERGVTLSGGQRARVNLARAVYSDADVYLLDDPLSAVDAAVGRHLFNKCILGHLSSKCCILITHQLQYLRAVGDILILKQGKMVGHGSYDKLSASGIDFASLLKRDGDESPQKKLRASNDSSTNSIERSNSEVSFLGISASMHSVASIDSEWPGEAVTKQQEEDRSVGYVEWNVYKSYFKAGCGLCGFIMLVAVYLVTQGMLIMSDLWLSIWATNEERNHTALSALVLFSNSTNQTIYSEDVDLLDFDTKTNILIYTAMVVGVFTFGLARAIYTFRVCVTASKNLHNRMFAAIIRTTIYFFDTNPVGRILNRFSRDIGYMDEVLPLSLFYFVQIGFQIPCLVIVASVINPWLFIPTVPLVILFMYLRKYYLATSRDIKRLEGVARSPVFSHLSASLQGLCTIRAFNAETVFVQEFDSHQDLHTEGWFLFLACSRWFSMRIDFLCACFTTAVAFSCVLAEDRINGGLVGLSLTYSLTLMGLVQWWTLRSAEVENQMTSVERVLSYSNIPPEAPLETDTKPDPCWPKNGAITMEGAHFKYCEDMQYVLEDIYLHITSQEKVGIVGRTGAGKSSLVSMLFRMSEPQGVIMIDDVDICEIGLHDLRSNISIIPQDPVMFIGTLRKNLDPFTEHQDTDLWKVLEQVQLSSAIDELPGGLETEIAESGTNLSVGQRQLVCLARAILRNNKILIIDEATANVDPRTDTLIQKTIRSQFQHCTVLTIAHRLNTVMDSERILVLDEGRVVEFDEPHLLLQNPDGHLYKFVQQMGERDANNLHSIAFDTYQKCHSDDKICISDAQRSYLQAKDMEEINCLESL